MVVQIIEQTLAFQSIISLVHLFYSIRGIISAVSWPSISEFAWTVCTPAATADPVSRVLVTGSTNVSRAPALRGYSWVLGPEGDQSNLELDPSTLAFPPLQIPRTPARTLGDLRRLLQRDSLDQVRLALSNIRPTAQVSSTSEPRIGGVVVQHTYFTTLDVFR